MIAIINNGGDMNGVCTYRVQINNRLITTFEHSRPDGLAECLRKAADAVDRQNREETLDLLVQLGQEMGDYDN